MAIEWQPFDEKGAKEKSKKALEEKIMRAALPMAIIGHELKSFIESEVIATLEPELKAKVSDILARYDAEAIKVKKDQRKRDNDNRQHNH